MVFVDEAGFTLDALEFRRAANPPRVTEAKWAARTGQVVTTKDGLDNVGQLAGTVTLGVHAAQAGANAVRFRYTNSGRNLTLRLRVNGGAQTT